MCVCSVSKLNTVKKTALTPTKKCCKLATSWKKVAQISCYLYLATSLSFTLSLSLSAPCVTILTFINILTCFFSVAALLLLSLSLALPSPAWAAVTKHHSTCAMIDDAAQRSNLYCPAVAHTHNSLPTPFLPRSLPDPVSFSFSLTKCHKYSTSNLFKYRIKRRRPRQPMGPGSLRVCIKVKEQPTWRGGWVAVPQKARAAVRQLICEQACNIGHYHVPST